MITCLNSIKKVGCYEDLTTTGNKPFDKVNILFGNNGSGKTTFSNILYLLSKHCKDKQTLFDELTQNDSEIEIETTESKIGLKNIMASELDIYVFNSKFVSDSVYNGNTSNIDPFSNEIKLTNEKINIIDKEIEILLTRSTKINDWIKEIHNKLDTIWKPLADDFQSKISNSRLTNVKPDITYLVEGDISKLRKELSKLYSSYSNVSKQSGTIARLTAIKERLGNLTEIQIDFEQLNTFLEHPISISAKNNLKERINNYQQKSDEKKIQNQIGDVNDWFKKGGRLLFLSKDIDKHCPLCNSDLNDSIDSILEEYTSHYSEAIIKLFDFLDNLINQIGKLKSFEFFNANNEISTDIVESIKSFDIQLDKFVYDKNEDLLSSLGNLLLKLKKKKSAPDSVIRFDSNDASLIKEYQESLRKFIEDTQDAIDKEINALKGKNIEEIVKEIKDKIKQIVSVELNLKENNIFESKRRNNSEIAITCQTMLVDLKQKYDLLETQRSEELSKLNAESKFVNIYLKHFGIYHFIIDRDKSKSKNNITITFTETGRKKSKFGFSLSEGEKTALAFAYFISKLRVEKIEGSKEEFENTVVVIDDPISSLDDNRVFQTANLIDSFLFFNKDNPAKQPKQLFILSHNLIFIKYMYNALRTNPEIKNNINEYYVSANSPYIKDLPSSLKNFTNTYIHKLKTIIEFKEKKIDYDSVKNYLPNYMRIVLETFLGFKLAKVNDHYDRLPGLDALIKAMDTEFKNYEDREINGLNKDRIIERLNHLKKISDQESHGNIHKAEQFVFISEEELRQFAKHTMQVINYIDEFHFKRVKCHNG
jgi:wobble nucleotide-excising tRNase